MKTVTDVITKSDKVYFIMTAQVSVNYVALIYVVVLVTNVRSNK